MCVAPRLIVSDNSSQLTSNLVRVNSGYGLKLDRDGGGVACK